MTSSGGSAFVADTYQTRLRLQVAQCCATVAGCGAMATGHSTGGPATVARPRLNHAWWPPITWPKNRTQLNIRTSYYARYVNNCKKKGQLAVWQVGLFVWRGRLLFAKDFKVKPTLTYWPVCATLHANF